MIMIMRSILFNLFFLLCFLGFSQEEDENNINFLDVAKTPIYEGCENVKKNSSQKKCMLTKLNSFIQNNFDEEIINCLKHKTILNQRSKRREKKCEPLLIAGEKRIFLDFVISKYGKVKDIKVRAPHIKLVKEGIRVANLIPEMVPGRQNGKAVSVSYTAPVDLIVK